jgi:uncharacterized protein YggE
MPLATLEEAIILRKYTILIILGLIALLSACERETVIYPEEGRDQMRVVGYASVTAAPDIATSQIGVQTFNTEVEPAVAESNRKSQAIIDALIREGIAEKDIQTSQFSIYPQRNYEDNKPEEIIGYQVNNTLSVVMRDLEAVGEVLQSTIDAGANSISGVNFSLDDPEPLRKEARIEAIKDARERAESMAEAAGIKLGDVISLNELTYPGPITVRADYDKAAAEAAVPVQPGELELTVQIELVFEILSD